MNEIKVYKQIPKTDKQNCCSLCGQPLNRTRATSILVYDSVKKLYQEIEIDLLFCSNCHLSYATSEIFTKIRRENNGFTASGFMIANKKQKNRIWKEINSFPSCYSNGMSFIGKAKKEVNVQEHPHDGFTAHRLDEPKISRTVYVANIKFDKCPCCSRNVRKAQITVPVSTKLGVDYSGYFCGEHFFIHPSHKFRQLINNNPYARHIKVDFKYHFKNYDEIMETFEEDKNHSVMILLKEKTQIKYGEKAIIFSCYSKVVNDFIQIMDYKEVVTRELLTQIFKHEKKLITFNGIEYEICQIVGRHDNYYSTKPRYVLHDVMIKRNGGYLKSIISNRYELVDVLIYSISTKRYELAKATYDKDALTYFMDITVFRQFVNKYGKAEIDLIPESSASVMCYGDVNFMYQESLLHAFGYNVDKRPNLSIQERHSRLAEVIDLGIMDQKAIVSLLERCIKRAKDDRYKLARSKWRYDIDFVATYKVDPTRFVILSK